MFKRDALLLTIASLAIVALVMIAYESASQRQSKNSGYRREEGKDRDEAEAKPSDWFMLQRVWPANELNRAAVEHARTQSLHMQRGHEHSLDNDLWSFAGPSNVGGRITALAVHPSAHDTVYAGAALGGVFKSTDGGLNFAPVFDQDFALSTGALAIDPSNPERIWLGTGEANTSGDSYGGNGVYLSEDGGRTWTHKGLDSTKTIGRIVVDPTDPNRVFVAAAGELFGTTPQRGLYRTTDGGNSWQRVLYLTDSTGCIDVALNPQHPDTVFAVMWERIRRPYQRAVGGLSSGIWRSYDGGDTWTELMTGLPHASNVGRGGIAVAAGNPNQLYAIYADDPGNLLGIYRSSDGGNNWQQTGSPSGTFYSNFGWYFGQIQADPVNASLVYVQGVYMYRSTNAGQNWSRIFSSAHVDHHALWIDRNTPAHLITGHDGGVNTSINSGSTSTRFVYLPVTQFYAITADPSLPNRLYGGTQDNSTPRTLTGNVNDWDILYGGDGFYCLVDPRSNNTIYAEAQYGDVGKSVDGGSNFASINSAFSSDRTNWCTPYAFNPRNANELYLGTFRVWRTPDGGSSWTAVSPDLSSGPGPGNLIFGTVTTLDISRADTSVIYAGTDDAHVWVSTNRGNAWTNISTGLPQRWVTRVVPHPDSAAVVYVALSGYKQMDYIPHLLRSSNYGATWTDVGAGLPEGPINDVIVDPLSPSFLYAATDFGVFYTPDYARHWYPLGNNLPSSAVFDLELAAGNRTLVAGTHGRSMWKMPLGSVLVGAPANLVIAISGSNTILTWSSAGGETGFTVYGATVLSSPGDSLTTVSDTTWIDTQAGSRSTPFYYYVRGRSDTNP